MSDLTPDPMALFYLWLDEAIGFEIPEPNAMTLATVSSEGKPSARIVLLKGATSAGFEFYTNYQSRKAKEMEQNPNAALVILWKELERQVRIEGIAEKLSFEKSQTYFQSRPRGSQIGAWASPQSEIIADRTILEASTTAIEEQYENVDPLPCPEHWGGYMLIPNVIEFWQGRSDRMHDRLRYTRNEKGANWSIDRLAP
ncbi:MAG: pyridoxamine 5'-phosphate oxidase [Bacteroidota bacterium]|nr:pyridoxamine 5'-phosphate oxidase [Bacteroidota bacterium]